MNEIELFCLKVSQDLSLYVCLCMCAWITYTLKYLHYKRYDFFFNQENPVQSYRVLLLLLSRFIVSDSVRPHRQQPTRFPRPWDSPDKNTGVGCHFLLQCRKVKSESEVTQSYPTPSDPMDSSMPGSSVHGIFQARVLEWGAIAFSVL